MTTQERINQLTNAALRSAPAPTTPKPVTYMPSFDELKGVQYSSNPGTAAAAAPAPVAAPAPAAVAAPAPAAAAPALTVVKDAHESDPDLKDMLDSRDDVRGKREKRNNRLATAALLLLFVSGGSWLTFSPTAREKMNTLVTAMKQSGKDVKSLGSIMGTYEKQLDKVAVQGARVDAAALALGVDPTADTSAQDASIAQGMQDLTGENGGPTVQERDTKLQQKFGIVQKLAKDVAPKTQKAESDVKF